MHWPMRFSRTLLLLAALCAATAVPLFIGHGLSAHDARWIVHGAIAAAAAAGLMLLHVRLTREPPPRG